MRLQKDYYDHIIRTAEDWERQAMYILCNPVRAGLVEYAPDYPFGGSSVVSKEDLFDQLRM